MLDHAFGNNCCVPQWVASFQSVMRGIVILSYETPIAVTMAERQELTSASALRVFLLSAAGSNQSAVLMHLHHALGDGLGAGWDGGWSVNWVN